MDLINKISMGTIAAGALVVIGTFFALSLSNAHLRAKLAEEQMRNTACVIANEEFAERVMAQNGAVEKLKEESAARERRAREAAGEAKEKARIFYAVADKLRKANVKEGDACKVAEALFDTYLEDSQ